MSKATTDCAACGGTVAFAAPACPHCGQPLDQPAIDAEGNPLAPALRHRAPSGTDRSWRISHVYFAARYLVAVCVPFLPVVWNLAVATPDAPEGATESASLAIPAPYTLYTALALVVLVSLPLVIAAALKRLSSRYSLSADGYLREARGLFARRTAELHVSDIRLVNLHQSLWQRLLDVGSLDISSAGNAGVEVRFEGIPAPEGVKRLIHQRAGTSDD
jgi:hypothetical protein